MRLIPVFQLCSAPSLVELQFGHFLTLTLEHMDCFSGASFPQHHDLSYDCRMIAEQDSHGFLNQHIFEHLLFDWDLWRCTSLDTQRSLFDSLLGLAEDGPTFEQWRRQVTSSFVRVPWFYADGFQWSFCFTHPTSPLKIPEDAIWRTERLRQLGLLPFLIDAITSLLPERMVCVFFGKSWFYFFRKHI